MRIGRDGLGFGSQRLPTKIQQPSQCCWHQMAHQAEKIGSEKARGGNIALTTQKYSVENSFSTIVWRTNRLISLKQIAFLISLWYWHIFTEFFLAFLNYVVGRTSRPISSGTLTLTGHLVFLIFGFFKKNSDNGQELRIPICSGTRAHLLSPDMGPSSSCCALSLSVSFDGSWEGPNIRRIFSIVVIHRYCYYLWIRAIRKWVLWRRVSQLPMLAFSEIL